MNEICGRYFVSYQPKSFYVVPEKLADAIRQIVGPNVLIIPDTKIPTNDRFKKKAALLNEEKKRRKLNQKRRNAK